MTSPLGCTWGRYVEQLAHEHGGWTALTQLLIRRAGPSAGLPEDPGSIERGLRRLKTRGNAPGGQYGRWLLEHFGVPRPLDETARWMGQYHSRFSDLPLSMCEAQLRLWDRPPIAESPAACWIRLGLASIAMRRGQAAVAWTELGSAGAGVPARAGVRAGADVPAAANAPARAGVRAGADVPVAALIEVGLLKARLDMDARKVARAREELALARQRIGRLPLGADRDCYHARWADQRAYQLIHGGRDARLATAARFYRSIDPHSTAAFALFRRHHGLAYCHWRLGERERAAAHARAALDHAGDAGLLRFRVMALRLLAHIEPGEAAGLRGRAERIIAELEHIDPDRARRVSGLGETPDGGYGRLPG